MGIPLSEIVVSSFRSFIMILLLCVSVCSALRNGIVQSVPYKFRRTAIIRQPFGAIYKKGEAARNISPVWNRACGGDEKTNGKPGIPNVRNIRRSKKGFGCGGRWNNMP